MVRLFHAEIQRYLTLDNYCDKSYVFLRDTKRPNAAQALSPKGLWEVEVINLNIQLSPFMSYHNCFCLRLFNMTLAEVEPDGGTICSDSNILPLTCIWQLR